MLHLRRPGQSSIGGTAVGDAHAELPPCFPAKRLVSWLVISG